MSQNQLPDLSMSHCGSTTKRLSDFSYNVRTMLRCGADEGIALAQLRDDYIKRFGESFPTEPQRNSRISLKCFVNDNVQGVECVTDRSNSVTVRFRSAQVLGAGVGAGVVGATKANTTATQSAVEDLNAQDRLPEMPALPMSRNQQLKVDETGAVVGPDETGCVKWFDEKKSYGFITPDALADEG
jgi:hypothetical protein